MTVTSGQVAYERRHVLTKLQARDHVRFSEVRLVKEVEVHPLFRVVKGEVETWEVTK